MFEQYISELFYKYDSVILPGLGAFVLKYIPASIHPIENKLSPPSKIVSFDPAQNYNDGILANYISDKKRISFIEANNEILAFVSETNKILSEGKQVILPGIGSFSRFSDNNLSFSPDTSVNYNLETFGMEEIISPPVLRDDIKERLQKQFSENKRTAKQKKAFPKAAIWTLSLVIVIVICIGAIFIIKPFNASRLSENKAKTVISEQQKIKDTTQKKENIASTDTLNTDTSTVSKNTSDESSVKHFYIISASFRIKNNADNYIQTLKKKGYNSEAIYLQEKGLYVVSYNSYATQAEAEQALSKILSGENTSAWILHQ